MTRRFRSSPRPSGRRCERSRSIARRSSGVRLRLSGRRLRRFESRAARSWRQSSKPKRRYARVKRSGCGKSASITSAAPLPGSRSSAPPVRRNGRMRHSQRRRNDCSPGNNRSHMVKNRLSTGLHISRQRTENRLIADLVSDFYRVTTPEKIRKLLFDAKRRDKRSRRKWLDSRVEQPEASGGFYPHPAVVRVEPPQGEKDRNPATGGKSLQRSSPPSDRSLVIPLERVPKRTISSHPSDLAKSTPRKLQTVSRSADKED